MARGKRRRRAKTTTVAASAGDPVPHDDPPPSQGSLIEVGEPRPGASPGTLLLGEGPKPRVFLIDYGPDLIFERELVSVDDIQHYLEDEHPSVTWVDVRGISDRATFERLGEIFKIHPLALEDVVNVPQRPHADEYPEQQLVIARMVQLGSDAVVQTEQLGIVFGPGWVLTVQEEPDRDCLECVRERIRRGRGQIRTSGSDYLAYALLDAVVDGFFPVLESFGERIEDLEQEAVFASRKMSRDIHDVKRELLTVRRAIWPQRDVVSALLRGESRHVTPATRLYLRDTYDHSVQVMDIVETYRELASGLMDLYLSGVSNRMNEVMKVLTVISTIFMPLTFIAGVYGMNFDNMPELHWRFGYIAALFAMVASVVGLIFYYRRKGWIGRDK